jgi:hypothetical protein
MELRPPEIRLDQKHPPLLAAGEGQSQVEAGERLARGLLRAGDGEDVAPRADRTEPLLDLDGQRPVLLRGERRRIEVQEDGGILLEPDSALGHRRYLLHAAQRQIHVSFS